MTASRTLKKDGPVSRETRERMLAVVQGTNDVPDQQSGGPTIRCSGFHAILVPPLDNLHFAETVQALTEKLEAIAQQVLPGCTERSTPIRRSAA